MTGYRIAHISDPHLSRKYYRENIKSLKMLLRHLVDTGVDHIVITGDIVSTANEDDYYLAREIFASLGLLRGDRLTVVPGNHDIFGGPHRATDVLSFPRHIRSVDYNQYMDLFHLSFAEAFEGAKPIAPLGRYPFVKRAGPFQIVGLNSIPPWSLRQNPLGTNGLIDSEQFEALRGLVSGEESGGFVRVVAMHHHFSDLHPGSGPGNGLWHRFESNTMRMRRRRRLLQVFRQLNVRYVLHGHIHRNESYDLNDIHFANGAGAVCDDPDRRLKYNLLQGNDAVCDLRVELLPVLYQTSTVDMPIVRRRNSASLSALAPRVLS